MRHRQIQLYWLLRRKGALFVTAFSPRDFVNLVQCAATPISCQVFEVRRLR